MYSPYNKSAAPAPVAPIPTGQMMNAICVDKFGGPEVLKLKKVPIPTPKADEVNLNSIRYQILRTFK